MDRSKLRKRLTICLTIVVIAVAAILVGDELLRLDSNLSIFADEVRETLGIPVDEPGVYVLIKMRALEARGRRDKAIEIGSRFTTRNPSADSRVPEQVAVLYLRKARTDPAHAEEDVREAMKFRDIAVQSSLDSPGLLVQLAGISEYAADLSSKQRCIEYRNALKIIDAALSRMAGRKDELTRHIKITEEDTAELKDLNESESNTRLRVTKLEDKVRNSGCARAN
jgi:hypothetical protein